MKIITLVRTLNEAVNIERFTGQYDFSDEILVSDSGSTDGTIHKAQAGPGVEVLRDFPVKIPQPDGSYYTHEPVQINFLIRTAIERGADWIIYDDCDCWPNKKLHDRARKILETTDKVRVKAYRLYVYGKDKYFPDMNKPGQSLWAWRPDRVDIHCDEKDPRESNFNEGYLDVPTLNLDKPLVLLHNFAQTEELLQIKMRRYEQRGQGQVHPTVGCGRLAKLPKYASI